jgi:hypothetical protein
MQGTPTTDLTKPNDMRNIFTRPGESFKLLLVLPFLSYPVSITKLNGKHQQLDKNTSYSTNLHFGLFIIRQAPRSCTQSETVLSFSCFSIISFPDTFTFFL